MEASYAGSGLAADIARRRKSQDVGPGQQRTPADRDGAQRLRALLATREMLESFSDRWSMQLEQEWR